jgi:hypothetical protein
LFWLFIAGIFTIGGWLAATHLFRLERHERLFVGFGLGLACYVWFTNVLTQFFPPQISFIASAVITLGIGSYTWWSRRSTSFLDVSDLRVWRELLVALLLMLFFFRLGAGMSIFDDRKNLSIISTMAAGDVPPHFYLDSGTYFAYHYGFQLFASSLVRLGGMYPWSAFDLAKGITWAYGLVLAYLFGRRITSGHFRSLLVALLLIFYGGTRYLLLLLPQSVLSAASQVVEPVDIGDGTLLPLAEALYQPWLTDGGPPISWPFAFQSGILRSIAISHAGPGNLSSALFFLILLVARRTRSKGSMWLMAILLATWGLTAETSYALFTLGVLGVAALLRMSRETLDSSLRLVSYSALIAFPIVLLQGGTFTVHAAELLSSLGGAHPTGAQGAGQIAGFSLRWPPAIVSAHLGELPVNSGLGLIVALAELGPIILISPWIVAWSHGELKGSRWIPPALTIAAVFGLILPIVLAYRSDRDITRLTSFGLKVFGVLMIIMWQGYNGRHRRTLARLTVTILVLMFVGSTVLIAVQVSAFNQQTLTGGFTELDALVTAEVWDQLDRGSEVFDSFNWRGVVVTGRLTRATGGGDPVEAWDAVNRNPTVEVALQNGFQYIYVADNWWWDIPQAARKSLRSDCVATMAAHEKPDGSFRRLLDLTNCHP